MAALPARVPIQVVNVDLAVERQKILREKLREIFRVINNRSKGARKELVYTVNAEHMPLETVLRTNPDADALFTAFNYDVSTSESYKEEMVADRPLEDMEIDPQLRYPVIAELRKLIDRGVFRHRQIVLVGDVYARLKQVLQSRLPLEIRVYANAERTQYSQPIAIPHVDRLLPQAEGEVPEGKYAVSQIHSLRIAGIPFAGIVNMPEVNNRFELKDHTFIDTARKLYSLEGLKEVTYRENLHEENLTFVRGKKVFMVLEPDLDHVVAERLVFDRMQQLYRYANLEEAQRALATGKSQGIVDYFETEGYDVVFDELSQDERDQFLLAVLGDRLGELLAKEIQSQKAFLGSLEDAEVQSILYNLPEPILNQVLRGLKSKSYERYLALVPVKIRENVIVDFLSKPQQVRSAWKGIGEEERKDILNAQAPLILAHLNLYRNRLFKQKFPNIKVEFDRNYDASQLKSMSKEDRDAAFSLFRKSLERAHIPPGVVGRQLQPLEQQEVISAYIADQPVEFYNRLNPLVRKQLWVTVGREYREHIDDTLHFLDKVEIIKGNREAALEILFSHRGFLEFLQRMEKPELSQQIFLALKRGNKVESKTALLKKLLASPEWKAARARGVPAMLNDPENYATYQKLADRVEGLEFVFDSLICLRRDYEQLKDAEPLRDATVILVDDLVDASLLHLFDKGYVDREEYSQFARSVEDEIEALRGRMAERETEDPLGVYILESMQMLNRMANQAMQGELERDQLQELDGRLQVRRRLADGMKAHLEKIEDFLGKADQQLGDYTDKIAQARKMVDTQSEAVDQAMQKAHALVEETQKLQQAQSRALTDKKRVAVTQRDLSLQFFHLIQPLLMDKIQRWPGPIDALIELFRTKVHVPEAMARRAIFKFTDAEIRRIAQYKVVFCTRDEILMQFILTCLRIDKLEDTLFSMSNDAATVPRDTDVLFYGPGFQPGDFEGRVKERRMVAFADQAFIQRLQANEKLKARTKSTLGRVDKELATRKEQIDAANKDVQARQGKRRQVARSLDTLAEERGKLEERIEHQKQRRLHFQGELELLEEKFDTVDQRFNGIRQRVEEVAGEQGETVDLLEGGRNELGESLRDDLVEVNRELARMMFIKGVKDAGDHISKSTQHGIMERMEAEETYNFKQRPFKKLIVADDGSPAARNIKRTFINVATQYFRINEMSVEDVSLRRMDGRAETSSSQDYPFIALVADRTEDRYSELRRLVRKVRNRMPDTFQLLFTPAGEVWKLEPGSEELQNLRSVKEHTALVNASIADYTNPANVLRVLQQKVPLE